MKITREDESTDLVLPIREEKKGKSKNKSTNSIEYSTNN